MDLLQLSVRRAGPVVVINIVGELDLATKGDLVELLDEAVQNGERCVCLNLTGLTFVDLGCVGLFVDTLTRLRQQGGDLLLTGVDHSLQQVLNATGLNRLFTLN
ncbi:STAS domain-containing protein [Actinomadura hibisca]|uniref:STAS domain-containing protein n=1 Tax=Actinomadura hibisca TaxID=68565 RepID=UPI000831DD43|nr:STAS domain-containing protein [Actinomadura hibisca]